LLLANPQFQLTFQLPTIYNQLDLSKSTTTTGIQIARNLQFYLLFAYNFNWHINCLQFSINLLFATLQLQLAFKCPQFAIRLLFAYNFNWHSNARNLQFVCSLPTISTGIQIACNLQSVALCLQLQLAYKLPASYNSFVLCLQLPFCNSILGLASASCTMPPKDEL
jgi:hypothetical protein